VRATVDAKEFSQALDKVSKAAAKHSLLPVLEGVLVQIANGRCTLTATDMGTWLTAELPAQGDNLSFVFLRTRDVVRACRYFEGGLTLETIQGSTGKEHMCHVILTSGPRAAKIETGLAEDFPKIPEIAAEHTFIANAAHLLKRIDRVRYTLVKPEPETKATACNVQFCGNNVFALDGMRMAWDTDQELSVPKPFMVPPEPLGFLKLFGDQEVSVQLSGLYLQITGEGISILTRLTEGLTFDMSGAIPKRYLEEFSVSPREFLKELSYLKEFIPTTVNPYVYFSGGRLSMIVAGGNYSTAIQIDGESGIDFAFDLRYMIDAMKQFKEEKLVHLKVSSPVAPIVIGAEGRSDSALVLPLRTKAATVAA